ncbi:MAG: DNA primase, partial [Lachnospiraceae bacterium]|nr:DNA primase [Lachnospiraceae bacterium]
MFTDEEEQREAAALFNTNLPELTTRQEREKAFRDIVLAVKQNSYEYFSSQIGTDMTALNKVIAGKKALEELAKTHISLD